MTGVQPERKPIRAALVMQVRRVRFGPVLITMLAGLGAGLIGGAFVTPHNPITNVTISELDGVAIRGRWIDVAFKFDRAYECDARVERWMWRYTSDGRKRWVQLDAYGSNPPTGVGDGVEYILTMPLPPAVDGGQWYYLSRTFDFCGWQTLIRGANVRITGSNPIFILEASNQ